MESIQRALDIYRAGGIICLILLILSVLLAVLFFFLFDIPNIFMLRTGRGKKLALQKAAENNAKTGALRNEIDMDYTTMDIENPEDSSGNDNTDKAEQRSVVEVLCEQENKPEQEAETSKTEEEDTAKPASKTEAEDNAEPDKVKKAEIDGVYFRIKENTAVIHTDESI